MKKDHTFCCKAQRNLFYFPTEIIDYTDKLWVKRESFWLEPGFCKKGLDDGKWDENGKLNQVGRAYCCAIQCVKFGIRSQGTRKEVASFKWLSGLFLGDMGTLEAGCSGNQCLWCWPPTYIWYLTFPANLYFLLACRGRIASYISSCHHLEGHNPWLLDFRRCCRRAKYIIWVCCV